MQNVVIDGRLIGYRHGGIATYARQLALRISAMSRSFELRIALRNTVPDLADQSLRVFTPPHHRFERFVFGTEMTLHQPDLLHAVDYVTPKMCGVRTVATVHDLAFLRYPDLVTASSLTYYRQILDSLPATQRVIAVSPDTREKLLDALHLPEDQVTMVPNGFDDGMFTTDSAHDAEVIGTRSVLLARATDDGRPIVLSVGTIEPRKRFQIILEVIERHWEDVCRLAGVEPLFVIAGQTGWLSETLINRIRRQASNGRLIWIRDSFDYELAAIYRSAEILVMPSLDEGFGLPVLEAMASGTPALVANTGALPWLVADSGFIEDTDDPAAWAEKIGLILTDRDIRLRRRARGIERARLFTWDETARQTADVYEEVLNEY